MLAYSWHLPQNSVSVARAVRAQGLQLGGVQRGLEGGCASNDCCIELLLS